MNIQARYSTRDVLLLAAMYFKCDIYLSCQSSVSSLFSLSPPHPTFIPFVPYVRIVWECTNASSGTDILRHKMFRTVFRPYPASSNRAYRMAGPLCSDIRKGEPQKIELAEPDFGFPTL